MLANQECCMQHLRCPRTGARLIASGDGRLVSEGAEAISYPIVGGVPILVDFETSVLDPSKALKSPAASAVVRKEYRGITRGVKRLLSPQKATTKRNVAVLQKLLGAGPSRLLIVGGGSVGQGMQPLYDSPSIEIYGFDIYASPNVQFVADAHRIPLPDDFFDGVVVQAVLEHVLQPIDVVREIERVLRPRGVVYAETPFMQQVHEGAFDFTRFTESGHRYLFRNFENIASGASGGPGTTFMWSVDYLVRGLLRSRTAGKLAKLLFFWVQYFDRIIPHQYAVDGASGVFFLGRKGASAIRPRDAIAHYRGAQ
jgi:SAM-dependent methyltransferase